MTAFKAYDIRGVWGTDLDAEMVYRIGYYLPRILPAKKLLVGRDIRLSSNELFEALARGLTDAGVNVDDAGLTTTPMIYWATGAYEYQASVMITASHNSKQYNGMKFSGPGVKPIAYSNGLNELEKLIRDEVGERAETTGNIKNIDLKPDYLSFLKTYLVGLDSLSFAIDYSNGMASLFAEDLFADAFSINEAMDGSFPGHDPNPLVPANQNHIKSLVLNNNADIGLIFDGDADRVMFIDEKGAFVSPDLIIALLAHYFFEERQETGDVVQDIRTSKAVAEYLKAYPTKVHTWKVGRAFGASKLKEVDGVYGGELAGHYYFRDFYYSDSGLLAALLVLRILKRFKAISLSFSQLIKNISSYANTGEVNFVVEEKQAAMDVVCDYFRTNDQPTAFYNTDGYRMEFSDWWFSIRPSNTEPYLRFLAEARSEELLQSKSEIIYKLISTFE